jgi:hypothetical protein
MMQDLWQKIVDSWHIKTLCSGAVTCVTFLLGDVTATPFVSLCVLIVVDTLTRWMAIGYKESRNSGGNGSIFVWLSVSFLLSRINSETFRTKFSTKAISYGLLIAVFNHLGQVIPGVIFGYSFVGIPNSFICTWLALGEVKSILENLIDSGITIVQPLILWAQKKQDQMTDASQQYGGYPMGRPTVPVPGRPAVRPNFAPDPNDKEGDK